MSFITIHYQIEKADGTPIKNQSAKYLSTSLSIDLVWDFLQHTMDCNIKNIMGYYYTYSSSKFDEELINWLVTKDDLQNAVQYVKDLKMNSLYLYFRETSPALVKREAEAIDQPTATKKIKVDESSESESSQSSSSEISSRSDSSSSKSSSSEEYIILPPRNLFPLKPKEQYQKLLTPESPSPVKCLPSDVLLSLCDSSESSGSSIIFDSSDSDSSSSDSSSSDSSSSDSSSFVQVIESDSSSSSDVCYVNGSSSSDISDVCYVNGSSSSDISDSSDSSIGENTYLKSLIVNSGSYVYCLTNPDHTEFINYINDAIDDNGLYKFNSETAFANWRFNPFIRMNLFKKLCYNTSISLSTIKTLIKNDKAWYLSNNYKMMFELLNTYNSSTLRMYILDIFELDAETKRNIICISNDHDLMINFISSTSYNPILGWRLLQVVLDYKCSKQIIQAVAEHMTSLDWDIMTSEFKTYVNITVQQFKWILQYLSTQTQFVNAFMVLGYFIRIQSVNINESKKLRQFKNDKLTFDVYKELPSDDQELFWELNKN